MTSIRIKGTIEEIRVGKIICLLRSYAAHADEMMSEAPPMPEFFLKPATAIIHDGDTVLLPPESREVHHEVEMAVVIRREGKGIPASEAMDHILGYAVFIDVTARDLQARAKSEGKPWTMAKGFDTFAPISDVVPKEDVPDPHDLKIMLSVNGEVRQHSNTGKMLFRVEEIIEHVSSIMTLERGDVIATGTPEGVGRIEEGDVVEAWIEGVGRVEVGVDLRSQSNEKE